MVARTTYETYTRFWLSCIWPLLLNNKILPVKAVSIHIILFADVFELKNKAPVIITKIGVSELSVPANAPSIPISATQNKYAGKRLPKTPDIKIMPSLFTDTFLMYLIAQGSKTIPAKMIRSDAT